jgi:hypothetical protein
LIMMMMMMMVLQLSIGLSAIVARLCTGAVSGSHWLYEPRRQYGMGCLVSDQWDALTLGLAMRVVPKLLQ